MTRTKKTKSKKPCYLCGKADYCSNDHIFPRELFLYPRPSNLLTAPACTACHSDVLSRDEELFRVYAASGMAYEDAQGRQIWKEKIRPSLKRRPKFRWLLRDSLTELELKSDAGLFLGKQLGLSADSVRIGRVLAKIVKGLYYDETGSPLPLSVNISWKHDEGNPANLVSGPFQELIQNVKSRELGNNAVTWWRKTEDDQRKSATWLLFYRQNAFLVLTYPDKQAVEN